MMAACKQVCWLLMALTAGLLLSCAPSPPPTPAIAYITAVPTLDSTDPQALCAAAEESWGRDWSVTLRALQALHTLDADCDGQPPVHDRLADAYVAQGQQLEAAGDTQRAQVAYEAALALPGRNSSAAEAVDRLTAAAQRCALIPEAALQAVPAYDPGDGALVAVDGTRFVVDGQPYPVYGANYYPRDTPFHRFLTETDLAEVAAELDLMAESGLNTLRIFLRQDDLFTCYDEVLYPVPEAFSRLDAIIQAAADRDLRLILVLNHDSVPTSDFALTTRMAAELAFIAGRYRDEPAILAWDLLDRGDQAYLSGDFSREQVLSWLAEAVRTLRQTDPRHLVTAGWWQNAEATAPLVDFVSFQHYGEYDSLRQRIALILSQVPDKPVLLSAVGYSTSSLDETAQRNLLYQTFEEIAANQMAGWVVYMAFDYPRSVTCLEPDCPADDDLINYYGIWNTSYFPKLAVDAVQRITGVQSASQ